MKLRVASCPFPFRGSFEHASAVRERAENVIVVVGGRRRAHTASAKAARGHYVTGETVATALQFHHIGGKPASHEIADVADAHGMDGAQPRDIDTNPSAACSHRACAARPVRAAGRSADRAIARHRCARHELMPPAVYQFRRIRKFRRSGGPVHLTRASRPPSSSVSGDAASRPLTRAFALPARAAADRRQQPLALRRRCHCCHLAPLQGLAWAVEEPISSRNFARTRGVGAQTGLTIILDESFIAARDLAALPTARPTFAQCPRLEARRPAANAGDRSAPRASAA